MQKTPTTLTTWFWWPFFPDEPGLGGLVFFLWKRTSEDKWHRSFMGQMSLLSQSHQTNIANCQSTEWNPKCRPQPRKTTNCPQPFVMHPLDYRGKRCFLCDSSLNTTTQRNRFTALFSGPPRWAGARRELLDFTVQGKINRGRHTDHLVGHYSIQTNQCPSPPSHFYRQDALPAAQPTASKHWRLINNNSNKNKIR